MGVYAVTDFGPSLLGATLCTSIKSFLILRQKHVEISPRLSPEDWQVGRFPRLPERPQFLGVFCDPFTGQLSTPALYNIPHICAIFIFFLLTYNKEKEYKVGGIVIDYSPLWETMRKKGISQYALIQAGIDRRTLDWLKKNKNITMLSLEKLCTILECTPDDIVRFIK